MSIDGKFNLIPLCGLYPDWSSKTTKNREIKYCDLEEVDNFSTIYNYVIELCVFLYHIEEKAKLLNS